LERWTPREHQLGLELWAQLEKAGPAFVPLNHPGRVLLRYQLLKTMQARGTNVFAVHRLWPALIRARFPVFIHSTDLHEGSLSPLLKNRWQLFLWLCRWHRRHPRRWLRGGPLVEEFCDVSTADGRFAKYSSFNMGGEIVPRHLFFGLNWCLKDTEIIDEPVIKAFTAYLRDNPDEKELRKIFALAHIDFGRIDYAFKDGKIQVWEINTNPMIIDVPSEMRPEEDSLTETFRLMIRPHFERLARLHQPGEALPYVLSGAFGC
jgi:hypothetical protein